MAFLITFIVACVFDFVGRHVFHSSNLGIIAAISMACMFIVYAIKEGKAEKSEEEKEASESKGEE